LGAAKGELRRECADLIVFMEPDASDAQIQAVAAELSADGAREVRYLNHDDALSEFSSIFASDPQLLTNVKPSALPTSYQVALASGADPDQMRTKYRAMLGVREVIIPPR
jgi:cell division protein FtsX